jgi:hypothetical protein
MSTPPGWHPDPEYQGQLRYWDGVQWTEDRALAPLSEPPQSRPKHTGKVIAAIVVGVLIVLGGCAATVAFVVDAINRTPFEGTWRVVMVDDQPVDDPDDSRHVFKITRDEDGLFHLDASPDYEFMELSGAEGLGTPDDSADYIDYLEQDGIEVHLTNDADGDVMYIYGADEEPFSVEARPE